MPSRIAPNKMDEVARTINEHPEIDAMDESQRGRIVDITARRLNGGGERPWGRKARRADGSDKNTDGMTYLRPDGDFEIYDVISGVDGGATWDEYGPFRQGENGYWAPPEPATPPSPPSQTHKYDGGGNDTNLCDKCGRIRFDPVHAIPESTLAHAYDGGEHDTGLCDVCQKPPHDPIHTSTGDLGTRVSDIERTLTDVLARDEEMSRRLDELARDVAALKARL